MSVRRQAYEWIGIISAQDRAEGRPYTLHGNPVLIPLASTDTGGYIPPIPIQRPFDIMVGGVGTNIEIPGEMRAYQFMVFDSIACWPPNASVNIRINTTYYFCDPTGRTGTNTNFGIPGRAAPFPSPNAGGLITMPSLYKGLLPPLYVLPGQAWGIDYTMVNNGGYDGTADYTIEQGPNISDGNVPRAYVLYMLIDGADALIAMKLLQEAIPVTAENLNWYKRILIENQLWADVNEPSPETTAREWRFS